MENNPKGSSSHCWILLQRQEAVVQCDGRKHVKLFYSRTIETKRTAPIRGTEGPPAGPPILSLPTDN